MNLSNQTLKQLSAAVATGDADAVFKAFTTATGLINYDLQPVARILYPVITPLRNMLPRVAGNGGTATNWRAITGINITNLSPGVAEGIRGGVITDTVVSYVAAYKTLGLEDSVTFEADLAAQGFDDAKLQAVNGLLRSLMIAEEKTILGGNTSLTLAVPATPTLADVGSGGSIGNGVDVYVSVVALTFDGYTNASVAGGVPTSISRTNADGTTTTFGGGSSDVDTAANLTTGAANDSVQAYTPVVQGAMGYAWFWGPTAGAAQTLGAITTINSVLITTATGAGTQTVAAITQDNSTNAYVFDGLIYLALGAGQQNPAASASGALVAYNATGTPGTGTGLTSDGAGGIVEIDADLQSFWDNFKLGPTHIFVNAQELRNITKKIIASGGSPLFRFVMDGGGSVMDGTVRGGAVVGTYLNKYTMSGGNLVKVQLHPNATPGTILYYSETLPYPLSNVANVNQIKTLRDYYQIEWPLQTRKYEYGVYVNEVLQSYFPPSLGVRYNIANG
jgi:hypothetical protein